MASIGTVLLWALALVATVGLIIEASGAKVSLSKDDKELLKKLKDNKNKLEPEKVHQMMNSIENKQFAYIGTQSVWQILSVAGVNYREKICHYRSLSEWAHLMKNCGLKSFQNVYNFVLARHKRLISYCKENFGQLYEVHQVLANLNEKRLESREEIEQVLRSVRYKDRLVLDGKVSVQMIIDQVNKSGYRKEDYEFYELVCNAYLSPYFFNRNLIMNLRKFSETRCQQLKAQVVKK